ncbi:thioredoxin [Mangrovimonas yunxiaonensis]|uniref:Thioredoxin n=1 Tax=Mangrovimonas yunxiaonensis TaxID=1197477 RepID=A0A084THQ4_9FLAO|nr:TlpA disulfide reductase family protein [Mangrovimonas yunxiaonensis]KFB00240.1 thioredoxin [Mangrovimonas yunxiaonensis]MBR9758204.1 TlpA family protein disulfide reductase [Algicola sp.]GGH42786.1 hypothetical protein GCM10011364_14550 [Mangrovimonas yunxiaonensis]
MKKTLFILSAITVFACNKEEEKPKDFASLSGTITNQNSDSISIRNRDFSKTIKVNEDGTFSDTLKVTPGIYSFFDGAESTNIYLKNGYDIKVTLDTKMFDETVAYTGEGAEHSNFLAQKNLKEEKLLDIDALSKIDDSTALASTFNKIKDELVSFYQSNTKVDTTLINNALKNVDPMLRSYQGYILSKISLRKELPKGSPSPVFENYENHAGGTTSLSDLKGKYVYVDVWATWCGPCKAEIPFLKDVEKKYHDKNIEFVSISIDDAKRSGGGSMEKAKEKWQNMVTEKQLGGIQLISDKNWASDFVQAYKINGIPRFILIDPDGNIVSPDAPRPSSDALIELFNELNI